MSVVCMCGRACVPTCTGSGKVSKEEREAVLDALDECEAPLCLAPCETPAVPALRTSIDTATLNDRDSALQPACIRLCKAAHAHAGRGDRWTAGPSIGCWRRTGRPAGCPSAASSSMAATMTILSTLMRKLSLAASCRGTQARDLAFRNDQNWLPLCVTRKRTGSAMHGLLSRTPGYPGGPALQVPVLRCWCQRAVLLKPGEVPVRLNSFLK